jgi:hypothetical protein
MLCVLTINQRGPHGSADRVPELAVQLRNVPTVVAFQRSVGDEVQGAVDSAAAAVEAALTALRARCWHVGIGIGGLHVPLPDNLLHAQGHALVYARRAVNRAQRTGDRVPLAVQGPEAGAAGEAEAVLRLLGRIVSGRTAAEWKVLDLLTPGVRGQQKAVAQELGITRQAVSKAVLRSQWAEEWPARAAAARLLELAGRTD